MQATMRQVMGACDALWPLMEARGLAGSTQYAVMRLWARLAGERAMYLAAELKLARECGTVDEAGNIAFTDERAAREYAVRREELLSEPVEIIPERVRGDAAVWEAMTPKALMQLEGLLVIEEASA